MKIELHSLENQLSRNLQNFLWAKRISLLKEKYYSCSYKLLDKNIDENHAKFVFDNSIELLDTYISWLSTAEESLDIQLIQRINQQIYNSIIISLSSTVESFLLEGMQHRLAEIFVKDSALDSISLREYFPYQGSNDPNEENQEFIKSSVRKLLPIFGNNPKIDKIKDNLENIHTTYTNNFNTLCGISQFKTKQWNKFIEIRNIASHSSQQEFNLYDLFNFIISAYEILRILDLVFSKQTDIIDSDYEHLPLIDQSEFQDQLHIFFASQTIKNGSDQDDIFMEYLDTFVEETQKLSSKKKIDIHIHYLDEIPSITQFLDDLPQHQCHQIINLTPGFDENTINKIESNNSHTPGLHGSLNNFFNNHNFTNLISEDLDRIVPTHCDKNNIKLILVPVGPIEEEHITSKWEGELDQYINAFIENIFSEDIKHKILYFRDQASLEEKLNSELEGLIIYPSIVPDKYMKIIETFSAENTSFCFLPPFLSKTKNIAKLINFIQDEIPPLENLSFISDEIRSA